VIGIVATLRDWKGHHDLLRAVASLSPSPLGDEACPGNPLAGGRGERHPLLVIVGDGPQRTSLERLVAELGIDERVRFAGEQVDVVPWLNAFDVFCLPSYSNEGVPQALMQAMACGIAAVTTPVGSIPEIVTDGATGVLVPPRDPMALAAALTALLGDPGRRAALGARAAAVARERFGEERMLDRMLEVFHAVARPA